MPEPLSSRSAYLLKILIERFIADGQPLASKVLASQTGLDISSATIRNIMAELEGLGLVTSRHTSGGKIPTHKGYRFFVNSLLLNTDKSEAKIQAISTSKHKYTEYPYTNQYSATYMQEMHAIKDHFIHKIQHDNFSPKQTLEYMSQVISELTSCACILFNTYQEEVLQQVELIALGSYKVLLIFISTNGDIQNHIFTTKEQYSAQQLQEAMEFINSYCHGLTISNIHTRLAQDIHHLQEHILELTQATILINKKLNNENTISISGEKNLIDTDLANNMQELKGLFGLFDKKTELLEFLQACSKAQGVQIFIGGETEVPLSNNIQSMLGNILPNISMVTTSVNTINNQLLGSLGVIGPTRMHYQKVISLLNITGQHLEELYGKSC
jgi:heat-inducible transcriptional repressor